MRSTARGAGIVLALAACACGGTGGTGTGTTGPATAPGGAPGGAIDNQAPPLRVAFGKCTAQDVAFVSGPRAIENDVGYVAEASTLPATGWGTIGTGKYGTIGHGEGTGEGYGVGGERGGMRGRRSVTPQVDIGNATATGDLDKNIIRRYIRRELMQIKYCYEKQLLVEPGLHGTVVAQFTIAPDGTVSASRASGMDKVSECVAGVIASIQFPKPKGGGIVVVRYPFSFRGSDDENDADEEPPEQVEDGGERGIVGEVDADEDGAFTSLTGTGDLSSGLDDANVYGGLIGTEVAVSAPVAAGPSPLGARRDAIAACLEGSERRRGVMVVDLDIAPDGTVTAARGHMPGGDGPIAACVAAAASELAVEPAEVARAWRCPLAYGEVDAAAHGDIDVTAAAITYGRVQVGDPVAIARDTEPTWKVGALYDALTGGDEADEQAPPPVDEAGPLVVRVVDDTRAKVLFRVTATVEAAGWQLVLAARDGDAWRPLRDPGPLPLVPVPRDTGAAWTTPAAGSAFAGIYGIDATSQLGVLVAGDSVWLGLTRVDESVQIRRRDSGAIDVATVAGALARLRESDALREGAVYAEVSAEDPVRFRDLVTVIHTVEEAGFTDWRLTAPNEMSVRFQK